MIDQLVKIVVRETKGPRSPDRRAAGGGATPNLKAAWPRRRCRRDKAQMRAFFLLRRALTGAIWLKVSRRG
jgi:hypothetical protein